jgi:hypothetical protein
VPARPTVCLPSSSRWRSPSPSRRCHREMSEEGEKADGGGGAGGGAGGAGAAATSVSGLSPTVAVAA